MHELKGLSSGSPICFLAALGMLRVLSCDQKMDVRLGWFNGYAFLEGIDIDIVLDAIVDNMKGRGGAPEFTWADSPRNINPHYYREACGKMAQDKRALGFMVGWATDTVLRDGNVSVTRLDMTSGQQKLLRDLRAVAKKITRAHIYSALMGGPYEGQTSFGLDPIAVRTRAHETQAPTKSKAPGKPGLIWLAFESIPLHPVVPVSSTRTHTIGWRNYPNVGYVWPVWHQALSFSEVRLLRSLPTEQLADRPGVEEVWFSRYGTTGKYGMLLPAERER